MAFQFQLVSASGVKYDGEAYEVVVPTKDGTVAIFEDHMPLLSAAEPGVLRIRKKPTDSDNDMEDFAVYGGVLQAEGKTARFVSEDVTAADEVSEQEALDALARAQKLVASASDRKALDEAKAAISRSEVRLNLAKLKKRHHH